MTMSYLKNVVSLSYSESKCVGCGLCAIVCPHGVFALEVRKAKVLNRDACMECGACALNCPSKAIRVNSGVGCAYAFINGWLTGGEPNCDCASSSNASSKNKAKCC